MYVILKAFFRTPPKQILRRLLFRLNDRVLSFSPSGTPRGRVLLSYITRPFTFLADSQLEGHANYWEAKDMAAAFLERGYIVDVIDFHNTQFIPKHLYDIFIDVAGNIGRISPQLPTTCKKIFFATGADPTFQNKAEKKRIAQFKTRRGVSVKPRRYMPERNGIAHADIIGGLCGTFPASTYVHYGKPMHMVHVSSPQVYPFVENKAFDKARKNFLWFGGAGAVHKGLDIVLDAFRDMPEFSLTVCGKFEGEEDFVKAYKTELYETANIHTIGYVNPASKIFERIQNECVAVISVSCSEGCATSIVVAMHAGLIPIVNQETGINVENFGIMLPSSTLIDLKNAIRALSEETSAVLEEKSRCSWTYARTYHTREQFGKEFRRFIDTLENNYA